MNRSAGRILKLVLATAVLLLARQSGAQVARESGGSLHSLTFESARLTPLPDSVLTADEPGALHPAADNAFRAFANSGKGSWKGYADRRHGAVDYIEGSGLAWIPGRGNGLTGADIAAYLTPGKKEVDLAALDRKAKDFLPEVADMLGLEKQSGLRLNLGRSGVPAEHVWFVDYDLTIDGVIVEGARVVFSVNNGNLVSIGSENLPGPGARAPKAKVSLAAAQATLAAYLGGFQAGDLWVDAGSYHLLPAAIQDPSSGRGYAHGHGRGIAGVWQFVFRREGQTGTFRGRVDAASGELLDFVDVNEYGQVTGGTYQGDRPAAERVLPMPFANIATGVYTNSAGVFSGTTGTSTLLGQYVGVSDSCGAISKAADANGAIAFGSSTGTDCTTPGTGGAGNTHAARTQFYALNRAKEVARGWLPANTWINARLTANVNLNQTCNAYWNGSTVNFFRSGGGCANTGELPGVSLHEYGHGLDTNDGGGTSPDNGTGETYGDFTAALATHSSCIGNGFLTSNCGGYGDACTSCTGVRDIDWAKHVSNTAATVANFTQTRCPQPSANNPNYVGPCGKDAIARGLTTSKREGHCESYPSSEALWDLAARDMPSPGSGAAWSIVDRLWYLSRSTAGAAFTCNVSTSPWSSSGCVTGSLFRIFRTVDDDNGNLADGTPHGGAIFAAFNRHGLACSTDAGASLTFAGCTPPAAPALTLTAGNNSAGLSFTGTGPFDVYRNETGCNAGFTKVANDVAGTSTTDSAVANGLTYFYQVVEQPTGNEACASAPSTCQSVTPVAGPCTPPAAPTGVTATAASATQVNVAWTASAGATSYAILRSTTTGGPYTQVGTSATTSFSDTTASCNTTYFYVVTASNGTCSSGNSAQASATTSACTGNVLSNGVPVSGISGALNSQQFWTMSVPAGATNLSFQTSGGTGDADLYVRFGSAPTTSVYDCRPFLNGNNETCSFATPQTGTYHVMLVGFSAYTGVTLVGSYTAGGGGGGSELIVNGGFETGTTPWVLSGAVRSTGSYPHSGVAYSYLGNVNNAAHSEYQQIAIPTTATGTMTFWLNTTSSETTTTTQYDRLFVEVRNTAGTLLATLATYSNLDKATAGVYSQKTLNVAAYKGQTVRIQFRGTTDSSLITTFRVDDVSVK